MTCEIYFHIEVEGIGIFARADGGILNLIKIKKNILIEITNNIIASEKTKRRLIILFALKKIYYSHY